MVVVLLANLKVLYSSTLDTPEFVFLIKTRSTHVWFVVGVVFAYSSSGTRNRGKGINAPLWTT